MHDEGERIHLVAVEQHIDLDQIARPVVEQLVVERSIALGARLERVEKVVDDLVDRHLVVQLNQVGVQILHILEDAAAGPGTWA